MYRLFVLIALSIALITSGCSTTDEVRKPTRDFSSIELVADKAKVAGPLTDDHWTANYLTHRAFLRECAVPETRPLGEMVLHVVVSKSGQVEVAAGAPAEAGTFSPETFRCISEETTNWEFPESGAKSEIVVRLRFSRVTEAQSRWGVVRTDTGDRPVLALDGKTFKPDRACQKVYGSGLRCGDVSLEFYEADTNLSAREFIETAARAQKIAEDSKSIEKAVRVPVVCEVHGQPVSCYMFQQTGSERRSILFGRDNGSRFSGAICEVPESSNDCLGLVSYEVLQ